MAKIVYENNQTINHSNSQFFSQLAPNVEVFELGGGESSEESLSPEDDAQALFIKVKEAQYKNAVAEAEIAKLKAKVSLQRGVPNYVHPVRSARVWRCGWGCQFVKFNNAAITKL